MFIYTVHADTKDRNAKMLLPTNLTTTDICTCFGGKKTGK